MQRSHIPVPKNKKNERSMIPRNFGVSISKTGTDHTQTTKNITGTTGTTTTSFGMKDIRKTISAFLGTEFPKPKEVKKPDFWAIWDACFARFPPGFQFPHDDKAIKEVFDLIGYPNNFNPSDFTRIGDASRFQYIFGPFKWIIDLLEMFENAKSINSESDEEVFKQNLEKLYACYEMFLTEGINDTLAQFVAKTYDQQMLDEAMELSDQVEVERHKIDELAADIEDLQQKKTATVSYKQKNSKLKGELELLEDQVRKLEDTYKKVEYEFNQNKEEYLRLEEDKLRAEQHNIEARKRANGMKEKQETALAAKVQLEYLMKEIETERSKQEKIVESIDKKNEEIKGYKIISNEFYNDLNEALKGIQEDKRMVPNEDQPAQNIAMINDIIQGLKDKYHVNNPSFISQCDEDNLSSKIEKLNSQKKDILDEIDQLKKTQVKKKDVKKSKKSNPQIKINELESKLANAQTELKNIESRNKTEIREAKHKYETALKSFDQYKEDVSNQLSELLRDYENFVI